MDHIESFYNDYIAQEGVLWSTQKGRDKVIRNAGLVYKAIESNITMCEKGYEVLKDFLNKILSKTYDWNEAKVEAQAFKDKALKPDYDRGTDAELRQMSMSYLKLKRNKLFNRADLKSDEVKPEMLKLLKACSENGTFANRLKAISDKYAKLIEDNKTKLEDLSKDSSTPNYAMMSLFVQEYRWYAQQIQLTHGDTAITTMRFDSKKFI